MGIVEHESATTTRHPSPVPSPYLAALLLLAACDVKVQPPLSDEDGDGFPALSDGGADCDDQDPATYPGAPDPCDGVDQSCDGVIDDETVVYLDADGDGYGAEPRLACPDSPGTSPIEGDCDDGVSTTFPGADDTCDDLADADCDGFPCLSGAHSEEDAADWPLDGAPERLWADGGHLRVSGVSTASGTPVVWSFDAESDAPGRLNALSVPGPVRALFRPDDGDVGSTVVGLTDQIGWITPDSSTILELPGLGGSLADRGDGALWASHPEEGTVYLVSPESGAQAFASGGLDGPLVRLDLDGDGTWELGVSAGASVVVLSHDGVEIGRFDADASRGLAAGDLDGDGLDDLSTRGADTLSFWSAWTVFDPGWGARATLGDDGAVTLADADVDGRADLLLVPDSGESVLFYADQLEGTLSVEAAAGRFPAGPMTLGAALGSGGADVVAGRDGVLLLWPGGPG